MGLQRENRTHEIIWMDDDVELILILCPCLPETTAASSTILWDLVPHSAESTARGNRNDRHMDVYQSTLEYYLIASCDWI